MIIGFLGVFLVGLFGATHISMDKDIIQDYPKDSWLRVDAELMETIVGGTQSLQIYIGYSIENMNHVIPSRNCGGRIKQKTVWTNKKVIVLISDLRE